MSWHDKLSKLTERASLEFRVSSACKQLNAALQKLGQSSLEHFAWQVAEDTVPEPLRKPLQEALQATAQLETLEKQINELTLGIRDKVQASQREVTAASQSPTVHLTSPPTQVPDKPSRSLDEEREQGSPQSESNETNPTAGLKECCTRYILREETKFCGVCGLDLHLLRMKLRMQTGDILGDCCREALDRGSAFCSHCSRDLRTLDASDIAKGSLRACPSCLHYFTYEEDACPNCGHKP